MTKKVAIDLFSGTGSATKAFQESDNWKVFRVEINEEQDAELHKDILEVKPQDLPDPDFIWASPPCTDFSIACINKKWTENQMPRIKDIAHSTKIVYHTLWLIYELEPEYWFLENPTGMLRKVMPMPPEECVTYCKYGTDYMKPTDLWGKHPESFEYKSCKAGQKCHISNPRDENTFRDNTRKASADRRQFDTEHIGDIAEERARVPHQLSKAILEAVENPGKKNTQSRLNALM